MTFRRRLRPLSERVSTLHSDVASVKDRDTGSHFPYDKLPPSRRSSSLALKWHVAEKSRLTL